MNRTENPEQKHACLRNQHQIHKVECEMESSDGEGSVNTHNTRSEDNKYSIGDVHSGSSINTSILDDTEEVKVLKEKLAEMEKKNSALEETVAQAQLKLQEESSRVTKLQKKLQFVKDNQEVFMKLKEAYINMKYNEASGKKIVEIREKGMQTWEGVVCRSCLQTEQLRRELEAAMEKFKETYVVFPNEMDQLNNTVKYLKNLIDRREKTWAANVERQQKIHRHIACLENENSALRQLLKKNEIVIDEVLVDDTPKLNESITKENASLKKIVLKYEKKLREIIEKHTDTKITIPLNKEEKKIVHQLMSKYISRTQNKTGERLRSRSVSFDRTSDNPSLVGTISTSASVCGRTPKVIKETEEERKSIVWNKSEEHAITMLDRFFESSNDI